MLLRLGRHYPGKTTWGKAHMAWLAGQKLEHLEQRIALEERLVAVRQAKERIERLEQAIGEAGAGLVAGAAGNGADGVTRGRLHRGDDAAGRESAI